MLFYLFFKTSYAFLTGLKIEDITDDVHETSPSESSAQRTEETSKHMNGQSENTSSTSVLPTNTEYLHALKDEESIRSASILFDTAIVPIISLYWNAIHLYGI